MRSLPCRNQTAWCGVLGCQLLFFLLNLWIITEPLILVIFDSGFRCVSCNFDICLVWFLQDFVVVAATLICAWYGMGEEEAWCVPALCSDIFWWLFWLFIFSQTCFRKKNKAGAEGQLRGDKSGVKLEFEVIFWVEKWNENFVTRLSSGVELHIHGSCHFVCVAPLRDCTARLPVPDVEFCLVVAPAQVSNRRCFFVDWVWIISAFTQFSGEHPRLGDFEG